MNKTQRTQRRKSPVQAEHNSVRQNYIHIRVVRFIHMVNHSIYHMDYKAIQQSESNSHSLSWYKQIGAFSRRPQLGQQGSFLVAAIVIILFLTAIGISLSLLVTSQYSTTKKYFFDANAMQIAEAGIEQTVKQINQDNDFNGFSSNQTFFDEASRGKGIYNTSVVTSPDGKSKSIVSVGQIFRNPGDSTPYVTRTIRTTLVGTSSKGYSVITGPGGLILGGSANITNSDVFVNGYVKLTGASQIGTQNNPVNVDVANIQCPIGGGAGWPEVCNDGTQPISNDWSTHIYGTVCATGQTSHGPNNNITGGNGGQGLKPGCIAPSASTPTYDRQAQIDQVTTTASATAADYNCSTWQNGVGFKRTWPANLKLTGNVNASSSCDLTITGNVYITGNLTIGGAATIRVADSVGGTRPVIMVDGTITVAGSGSMEPNADGTGLEFISFKNSTGDPSVTSLNSAQLYASQKAQTVSVGGAANLPGMIFDSYWGKITIGGSGTIGSAIGKTVDLSGAGTVTFGTEVASGTKTWTIRSYQRLYN